MKHFIKTGFAMILTATVLFNPLTPQAANASTVPPDETSEIELITEDETDGTSIPEIEPTDENNNTVELFSETSPEASAKTLVASVFTLPMKAQVYRVSSHFGYRCPSRIGAGIYHGATDLAAPDGTPLYAMANGVVSGIVEPVDSTTTGTLLIDHGTFKGKKLIIGYSHPWEPGKYVQVGSKITKGQHVADVGASGIANGPHLHLSVHYGGVEIEPLTFFKSNGLDITVNAYKAVPVPVQPETCDVYVHAAAGLKETASNVSKTLEVIPNNTFLKVATAVPVQGYFKVKSPTGKTGFIRSNTIAPKARATDPILNNVGTTEPGLSYTLYSGSLQNFRDFPSLILGESGLIDTLGAEDTAISTGRMIKNTAWYEFRFDGRTGWMLVTNRVYIKNIIPNTVKTESGWTKKTHKITVNKVYQIPTKLPAAKDNQTADIKVGTVVTSTGRVANGWVEITVNGKNWWTPSSTLTKYTPPVPPTPKPTTPPKPPVTPTPPPKPVVAPSVKKGDVVAKDKAGILWNYGNLTKTPKPRKQISSGWKTSKDILVTDFNADGTLDLVANFSDGRIYVYAGKPSGGFNTKTAISTSSGWKNLELHAVKMKKTDKYPSIITRTPAGIINLYSNNGGKSLNKAKTIGTGWGSFKYLTFAYFDKDNNIDALPQTQAGNVILYRTNGSVFVNETRKTVGSGWSSLKPVTNANMHGTNSTGLVSIHTNGKLYYYGFSGNSKWNTPQIIGNSSWSSYYIAKQSI